MTTPLKKSVSKKLFFYLIPILITSIVFPDIIKYLTIQELTEGSDIIVIGTVEAKTSSYTADNSTINTNVIINPSSVIKGNVGDGVINVTVWGGQVGDIVLIIDSSPYFEINESVLLFIRTLQNEFEVTGWIQGKFEINYDSESNQYTVTRNLQNVLVISEEQVESPIYLNDLIDEITSFIP